MSDQKTATNLSRLFEEANEGKIALEISCTPDQAIELLNFFKKIKKVD